MTNGYDFYIKYETTVLTFPVTPGELQIKVGSKNETVSLINEGEINLLKSPALVEVSFTARFPMRQYPYARDYAPFQSYYDVFKELKEQKKPFRFVVVRTTPRGDPTWDTNLLMALETMNIDESSENGDDVMVELSFKQYKEYGVTTIKKDPVQETNNRQTDGKDTSATSYTIKSGDTLWAISKKYLGSGTKWKTIYNANKNTIETAAKSRGMASSSNGHWIFPGVKIVIPAS